MDCCATIQISGPELTVDSGEDVHFKYIDDGLIQAKNWSVECWTLHALNGCSFA